MAAAVSPELYERYKEAIFQKSANVQVRPGDPVRLKDWTAVSEQRELMGLTDEQIAEQLGLEPETVTAIRTQVEKEKYRFDVHQLIYKLKGSRKAASAAPRPQLLSESGPLSSAFLCGRTLGQRLSEQARKRGQLPAIVSSTGEVTFAQLEEQANRVAGGLHERGVSRGDLLVAALPVGPDLLLTFAAAGKLGAIFQPVPLAHRVEQDTDARGGAGGVVVGEGPGMVSFQSIVAARPVDDLPPVQPDQPLLVLPASCPGEYVVHSHDTLLSGAWFQREGLAVGESDVVACLAEPDEPLFSGALVLAWQAGAAFAIQGAGERPHVWSLPELPFMAYSSAEHEGATGAGEWAPGVGVELRAGSREGPLWVRTPHLCLGVWKNGAIESLKVDADGWFQTAARGLLNERNQLIGAARSNNTLLKD